MRSSLLVAAAVAVSVAGCGSSSTHTTRTTKPVNPNAKETSPAGDIPDNQVYVPFTVPGSGVTVKVPEGWSRKAAGAAVVFSDNLNSVRIQTARASAPPSAASVKRNVKDGRVSKLSRAGGTAIRVKYLAKAPQDPVTGKRVTDAVERYYYVRNGKELILTLSGPKGADNVDPWRLISNSVRWK